MRPPLGTIGCEVPISMFTLVFKAGYNLRDACKITKSRLGWQHVEELPAMNSINNTYAQPGESIAEGFSFVFQG